MAERTKRQSQPPKRLLDDYVPVSNAKREKKMVKDNCLYEVEIVAIDKQEKKCENPLYRFLRRIEQMALLSGRT